MTVKCLIALLILLCVACAIAVYYFYRYKKLSAFLAKFMVIPVLILICPCLAQDDIELLDDKPVVLPEIGRDLDEVVSSLDVILGLPGSGDPGMDGRDYYGEEMLWRMGLAAFLQDENVTNSTLFYA